MTDQAVHNSQSEKKISFGKKIPVLDDGYVILLDVMGDDEAIGDAARLSYDRRGKTADRALLRYLMRHRHTSPFEMGEMRFELKMPIFVARQWVRHRTCSMNELSARYTELPEEMFVPEKVEVQSTENKQGREKGSGLDSTHLRVVIDRANHAAYSAYQILLDAGVSREIARGVLPLNIYTKKVWKMDLHNLMHFLKLRLNPGAQEEIRVYAEVMEKMVAEHFPITYEAFVDYSRDAYLCSRMEVDALKFMLETYADAVPPADMNEVLTKFGLSKREATEFKGRFLDG